MAQFTTAERQQAKQGMGAILRAYFKAKAIGAPTADGIDDALERDGHGKIAKAARTWRNAVSKALGADYASGGTYLIPSELSINVLSARRARAKLRGLGVPVIPMGMLKSLPRIDTGAVVGYIGENALVGTTQPRFGNSALLLKKAGAQTVVSNDLLRYSPIAERAVNDDLGYALAVLEDSVFVRSDGFSNTPRGLRYQVAPSHCQSARPVSLANVASDLGDLVAMLFDADVPEGNWAWLMAPRSLIFLWNLQSTNGGFPFRDELKTGRLYGFPFAATRNIPVNLSDGTNSDCSEVYLVNIDDTAIGDSFRLAIDLSTSGAYDNGTTVVAGWSRDESVIRVLTEHDFALRDPNAAAVLTSVRWGA